MSEETKIPAYVDAARLCQELCISERTADAWTKQGILPPPRQRGGKRLWKWKEVEGRLDGDANGVSLSPDPTADGIRDATRKAAQDH